MNRGRKREESVNEDAWGVCVWAGGEGGWGMRKGRSGTRGRSLGGRWNGRARAGLGCADLAVIKVEPIYVRQIAALFPGRVLFISRLPCLLRRPKGVIRFLVPF